MFDLAGLLNGFDEARANQEKRSKQAREVLHTLTEAECLAIDLAYHDFKTSGKLEALQQEQGLNLQRQENLKELL